MASSHKNQPRTRKIGNVKALGILAVVEAVKGLLVGLGLLTFSIPWSKLETMIGNADDRFLITKSLE